MAIILKTSVRFSLKKRDDVNFKVLISYQTLEREVFFLFLLIAVVFELKKKNESKRKYRVPKFFHRREEKRPFNNLTRNEIS